MKRTFTTAVLIACAIAGTAQEKKEAQDDNHGYAQVGALGSTLYDGSFGGTVSIGQRTKDDVFAIGATIDVLKSKDLQARVTPAADLRAYLVPGLLYVNGQFGYSIMSSTQTINNVKVRTTGGLYYGGGLGAEFQRNGFTPFIAAKYVLYPLRTEAETYVRGVGTISMNEKMDKWAPTFSVGVRF